MPTELRALMLLAALGLSPTAQALLAGTAPDTPQAREIRIAPASRWAGVGEVLTPAGRFGGVAVASDLVLTAAHVAARYADHPGQVHFQAAAGIPVAVAHIAVMPAYRFPSHDLALLTLARPLPDAVPRYALLDRPLQPGDVIEFVAAGRSGRGDTGPDTPATPGVFRYGRNVVDWVGERLPGVNLPGDYFLYDFDGPEGAGITGGASLGNTLETLVASGDSGSPVFLLDASGPPQLAGINTLVIGTGEARRPRFRFGDLGAGTDLGATTVNAWLDQAAAGHTRRGRPPETGFRWMRESLITGVLLLAVVAVLRYRWRSRRH